MGMPALQVVRHAHTAGSGTDHGNGPGLSKPGRMFDDPSLRGLQRLEFSGPPESTRGTGCDEQDVVPDDPDGSIGFHDVDFPGGGVHRFARPWTIRVFRSARYRDAWKIEVDSQVRGWARRSPKPLAGDHAALGSDDRDISAAPEADRRQDSGVSHPQNHDFRWHPVLHARRRPRQCASRFGMGAFRRSGSSGAGLVAGSVRSSDRTLALTRPAGSSGREAAPLQRLRSATVRAGPLQAWPRQTLRIRRPLPRRWRGSRWWRGASPSFPLRNGARWFDGGHDRRVSCPGRWRPSMHLD